MECVQLTEAQRQEFEENGYLIVRSAIDSEMIGRLTEASDRLMESFEYHGYYAHRRDGLVQDPAFADLATQSKAVPLILQLLGTNVHITNTALIHKHPQAPEKPDNRNWHRDGRCAFRCWTRSVSARWIEGGLLLNRFQCAELRGDMVHPEKP